jgi:hypothetical protein
MGFDAIIRLGPMALLAAVVAMIYLYRHNRQRHATAAGAPPSLVAYVGVALVVGALAYVAGAALGIYALFWTKRACRAKHRETLEA